MKIDNLFLNLLFLLTPLLLYQLFYTGHLRSVLLMHNKFVYLLVGILLIYLFMQYPIRFESGIAFDLRAVPLMIGFLYGGRWIGLILFGFVVLWTFPMLFRDAESLTGALSLTIPLLWLIQPKYATVRWAHKCGYLTGVNLIVFGSHYGFSSFSGHAFPMQLLTIHFLIMTASLLGTAYVIEKMRDNFRLREREYHIDKAQIMKELAASVSHEIRNPLTVARGFLQMLKHSSMQPNKEKEYFSLALRELNQVESVINDYTTFARPRSQKPSLVDLASEVRQTVNLLTPFAVESSVRLSTRIAEACWVNGEREKVRQCIVNLIKNGLDSMPYGGELTVSLHTDKRYARLQISDSGIGMSKEEIRRFGEPYYWTEGEGTGLSMMVVFSIIQSMNGQIAIQSEKGKGTCISITLPLAKRSRETSQTATQPLSVR